MDSTEDFGRDIDELYAGERPRATAPSGLIFYPQPPITTVMSATSSLSIEDVQLLDRESVPEIDLEKVGVSREAFRRLKEGLDAASAGHFGPRAGDLSEEEFYKLAFGD